MCNFPQSFTILNIYSFYLYFINIRFIALDIWLHELFMMRDTVLLIVGNGGARSLHNTQWEGVWSLILQFEINW